MKDEIVTGVVDYWKTKSHISKDTLPKYDIEKFNNTYNNIQDSLDEISDTNELNIGELKTELKTLFKNLTDIVFGQSKQIIELENRIAGLEETTTINENRMLKFEKKLKMMDQSKVTGDLLGPLVTVGDEPEKMYEYINSLPGQPRKYNDSSIFRAFQAKINNDQTVENEYKQHFNKKINEVTYELFYQWIFNKANMLNIPIDYLLSFLYVKKIRNLTHHSDIEDFFQDSRTTFRYILIDLLSKYDIQDVMTSEEVHALNRIFETYYAEKINDVRQLQEQAGAGIAN